VKIVIAGGGTAGHVFPAVALADRLAGDHDVQVEFIGSSSGQEAVLIPRAGYVFHGVGAAPLRRELSLASAKAPFVAAGSVRACGALVRDAQAVVGMGGYASVPAVLAARRARVPVVLHEQNAVPGLANRLLARVARSVGVSFADAAARFPPRVAVAVTGNPVRAQVRAVRASRAPLAAEAAAELDLDPERSTVVVFGGSQGALHVDQVVAEAIAALADRADLQLVVLTGREKLDVVARAAERPMGLRVRALAYLERVELVYAIADLAVARAGATSIAEMTVCGIPSILIPYPHATEDHQTANARELVRAGAAELYPDAELSADGLARRILDLVDDGARRASMGERATAWSTPDADERLAALVLEGAG
jgi:UDP-N-acetylglucosamine--N-acetylmuramyl-(pentapeptide) pyrophosphoryl-undecaprenol N-acetylglucosamine transferase